MKRREFLKTTALAGGALAATPLVSKAEPGVEAAKTTLKSDGYVREPARKIPLVDSADVVVVGGGPAGVSAAIAASRGGSDVLLLEREYFLGGLFTGCGVTPIINMYTPDPDWRKPAVAGVCKELVDRLDAVGMICNEKIRPKVDPEAAKYYMEEMIAEAGVRILYGVQVAQVVMSGSRIDSVVLESKSGRVAVKTKFVVDCSGDGDVLEWSGEDFNVYKEDIGAMWRIGHAENFPKGNPTPTRGVKTRHTPGERKQDGLDIYNLTRIQLKMRKDAWKEVEEGRKQSGCEDLYLVDTPSVVGVRITRVLNSVGNVSARGAVEGRRYDDAIGFAGADSTMTVDGRQYKNGTRPMWQVPYSAITPKTVQNLLVGGRCFGFERPLTYDAREIGCCFMTGQAAGSAAAIAVASRCSCREVDIHTLQNSLRKQNVILSD